MIIARVYGGLGNQLFIYATARALARRMDQPLVLDPLNGYSDDRFGRCFQLPLYSIEADVLPADAAKAYDPLSRRHYWRRKLNRYLPLQVRPFIEERKQFLAGLLGLRGSRVRYLDGYWQSERYFADCSDLLRRELTLRQPVRLETQTMGDAMRAESSICLHARRVDYGHLLGADYYHRAVKRIVTNGMDPVFYVFSDNMDWARQNLQLPGKVVYVEGNGEEYNYEDMWLMNRCHYHIIANSSFSWWGAWLKDDPSGIVVAPSSWGYGAEVPDRWVTC
jgi:hypothetical protein